MDNASEKNMEDLIKIGQGLLKKPLARVSTMTGVYETVDGEPTTTNHDQLKGFAKILTKERKERLERQNQAA